MNHPSKYNDLLQEVTYKATTSGGKGGQHVNKVSTRIELYFDVRNSVRLDNGQKEKLLQKLSGRISNEGVMRVVCSRGRSQFDNKELAKETFLQLVSTALLPAKERKATKPKAEAKEKRLDEKKRLSEKKRLRGNSGG